MKDTRRELELIETNGRVVTTRQNPRKSRSRTNRRTGAVTVRSHFKYRSFISENSTEDSVLSILVFWRSPAVLSLEFSLNLVPVTGAGGKQDEGLDQERKKNRQLGDQRYLCTIPKHRRHRNGRTEDRQRKFCTFILEIRKITRNEL